jgi:hypothetical protein
MSKQHAIFPGRLRFFVPWREITTFISRAGAKLRVAGGMFVFVQSRFLRLI